MVESRAPTVSEYWFMRYVRARHSRNMMAISRRPALSRAPVLTAYLRAARLTRLAHGSCGLRICQIWEMALVDFLPLRFFFFCLLLLLLLEVVVVMVVVVFMSVLTTTTSPWMLRCPRNAGTEASQGRRRSVPQQQRQLLPLPRPQP